MSNSPRGRSSAQSYTIESPAKRRSSSRSATRALHVLELFGRLRQPLRAVQIARALDLHPSTANQLLKTMMEASYLSFDAVSKTYMPSPRLARFSHWMTSTYGGDEKLWKLVREVHAASGEMVTLTTPNDLFMQVVDMAGVSPTGENIGEAERGLRVSIFGSASGSAYLSTLGDREIRRLAERARLPINEQVQIIDSLVTVRRDGVASGLNASADLLSLAVPLQTTTSNVPLVLAVVGPNDRLQEKMHSLHTLLSDVALRMAE